MKIHDFFFLSKMGSDNLTSQIYKFTQISPMFWLYIPCISLQSSDSIQSLRHMVYIKSVFVNMIVF